jgi:hypothetical protein
MTIELDDVIKNQEETQYREVRQSTRSQRDKLRALRDEFGFKPTEYKKPDEDENND